MGNSNNRIIVNSEVLYDYLNSFPYFQDEEAVILSGGRLSIARSDKSMPVEVTNSPGVSKYFSIDIEGKKMKRLRKILKHMPVQPIVISFDSHIEIEGITI